MDGTLFADTNHYHPLTDGKAYAATGAPVVGIKIGQGGTKDSAADSSVATAEKNGLMVIGYIFGTNRNGADQADQLMSWFPWQPGRMWCIDNEDNGPNPADSITNAQAAACVNRLRSKHPKKLDPWSYSLASRVVAGAHHWVAQYNDTEPNADAWQYYGGVGSGSPRILPGVAGPTCDMNKLLVPEGTLRTWAGLDPAPDKKGFLMALTDKEQQNLKDNNNAIRRFVNGVIDGMGLKDTVADDQKAAGVALGEFLKGQPKP